jgi:hypothetical protein
VTNIDWSDPQNVLRLGQLIGASGKIVDLANSLPPGTQPWQVGIYDQVLAGLQDPAASDDTQLSPDELAVLLDAAAELDAMGLANSPEDDVAGLSQRGQAIYKKLIATGMPHARALKFARNAQKAQPGQAPQLSNGQDPSLTAFAAEMAEYAAEQGDYDVAAQTAQELGMGGIELAGGDFATVAELANASFAREQQRLAEDAEPLAARSEDRLARALARVGTGSYAPRRVTTADLASPSQAARTMARHRYRQEHADDAAITFGAPCGVVDDYGRCGEPYHTAGCSGLATSQIAEALQASGTYADIAARPAADAQGSVWLRSDGQAATWRDHVEALTGQRQQVSGRPDAFRGSQELAVRRAAVFGDPADPDDVGTAFPDPVMDMVDAVRQQAGIPRQGNGVRARP